MKKEPPINLAKCKIGQQLKMRNGYIAVLRSKNPVHSPFYPFSISHKNGISEFTASGTMFGGGKPESPLDIIAILPLPKKKAKTATPKNPANQASQRRILAKIEADFDRLGAAIARLKEAFEP